MSSVMKTVVTKAHTASTRKCSTVARALLMWRLYLQRLSQFSSEKLCLRCQWQSTCLHGQHGHATAAAVFHGQG